MKVSSCNLARLALAMAANCRGQAYLTLPMKLKARSNRQLRQ